MDELITCSVCLRRFEDPRVLPCQHTFCLDPCLNRLIDHSTRKIKCPLCRQEHYITQGNVERLAKNLTMKSLIDMPSQHSTNRGSVQCVQCQSSVEFVKCCECCSKSICRDCYLAHLEKTKESLRKMCVKLRGELHEHRIRLSGAVDGLSRVEKHKNQLLLDVNHQFSTIQQALQQRRAVFTGEITRHFQGCLAQWRHSKDLYQLNQAVLASSLAEAESVLQRTAVSQSDLIKLRQSLESTLPQANNNSRRSPEDLPTESKDTAPDFRFNADPLLLAIAQFGRPLSDVSTSPSSSSSSSASTLQSTSHVNSPPPVNIHPANASQTVSSSSSSIGTANPQTSLPITSHSSINQPMTKEKTFILNRPAKCISYDIPMTDNSGVSIELSSTQSYINRSKPLRVVGKKGSGLGELIWPRGVCCSEQSQEIYVADSSNHRIQVFTIEGKVVQSISLMKQNLQVESTSVKLTFDCVSDVAISNQMMICSDRYNHRLVLLDYSSGQVVKSIEQAGDDVNLMHPCGVALDNSRKSILVCDKDKNCVHIYSLDGQYRSSICLVQHGDSLKEPQYVAVCPVSSDIFISDTSNHRILIFSGDSTHYTLKEAFNGPTNEQGQQNIAKLKLKLPKGLAFDSSGNLFVCDSGNNRCCIYSGGTPRRLIGQFGSHGQRPGQFKGMEGICIMKSSAHPQHNHIIISDRDNHRIQIF